MIPPTIIVTGDKDKGYELKKFALQQLDILERSMSFQKLNEGFRTVRPYEGVVVECWSSFSTRVVVVHVVKPGRDEEDVREEIRRMRCLCFPHFSFGRVLAVYPELPVKNKDPDSGLEFSETAQQFQARWDIYYDELPHKRFSYDLSVCAGVFYVIFLGAKDANLGRYYVNQYVVVTLGEPFPDYSTDCARSCLLDKERFEHLTISPFHIKNNMFEWVEA